MSFRKVKLKEVLKQYRIQHIVQDNIEYRQVTISKYDGVTFRGSKIGKEIGRKRQFIIDLKSYPNTLMLVRQGVQDGSIGIVPKDVDRCIATENMPMFSVEGIDLEYLRFLLKSPFFYEELKKIETTGSAQKSIHERQILEIEIPLPDLKEQKQFVIELTKIKNSGLEISSELNKQISFIKQLRQAFLKEAMQGLLVKTDAQANQETGKAFLETIKAEKAQLIAEGKLKKEKPLPPISEDEIPFEIPEHWVWCRLGEVVIMNRGKFSVRPRNDPDYFGGEYPFIQIGSLNERGSIIYEAPQSLNEKGLKVSKKFPINTIAIAIVGGTIANLGVLGKEMCFTDSIVGIYPHSFYNQEFILNFLRLKQPEIKMEAYQMAGQPNIKIPTLENILLAMPPMGVQEEIVAKLDELMRFCDGLETSIKESQGLNDKLLQEVLREVLSGEVLEN